MGGGRRRHGHAASTATTGDVVAPPIALGGALVDVVVDGDGAWVGDIEAGHGAAASVAMACPALAISVPAGVVRLAWRAERMWVTGVEDAASRPSTLATGAVR